MRGKGEEREKGKMGRRKGRYERENLKKKGGGKGGRKL